MRSPKMAQGPGGYRPSVFMDNYPLEEYQYIAGIDESRDEKHLIYFTRRRMFAYTDQSDGITYRKGSVATDGLGLFRFVGTGGNNPNPNRVIGLYQSSFNSSYALASIYIMPPSPTNNFVQIFSAQLSFPQYPSNISKTSGSFSAPFPFLSCVAHLNSYDVYTDGFWFTKLNGPTVSTSSDVIIDISQFTITPTAYGAGILNGFYAYAITLVDANNNETNPSYFNGALNGSVNFSNATNNTINMTIDIGTVYDTAAQNFSKIRVYRTLTNSSAPSASQNPTMYLVNTINIVAGTHAYSFADNNSDASISTGINPNTNLASVILANVNYNQQLLPFSGQQPKFLKAWNNRLFIANVANFPSRIFWSDFTDNTLQANGNVCSWNLNSFLDVDANDGYPIIGMFPGLGGRLFIFKENGTWIISSTGSTTTNAQGQVIAPYRADKINNEYGLYDHSIAEVGGTVYGRTKDGIVAFNGSTYKIISNQIRSTLQKCIVPEGDSGVYDVGTGRYYLAVCDSRLSGSFNTSYSNQNNIMNAFRNQIVVFDATSGTWEIHKNQFIQFFSKLKDSYGKQIVFGAGMFADLFAILPESLSGFSYHLIWTGINETQLTSGNSINGNDSLPQSFVGKKIYILTSVDSNNNFSFVNYKGTITTISGTTVTVDTPLPTNTTNTYLVYIDASYSTITSSDSTTWTDTNNFFTQAYSDEGYSFAFLDPANVLNDTYGIISSNTTTVVTPTTGTWTGFSGFNYILLPYRYIQSLTNTNNYETPRWLFMTPPIGDMQGGQKKKKFNQLKLEIKGTGTLRIRIFLNGSGININNYYLSTPDQTIYSTIPTQAANGFWPYYIRLRGAVANYIRAEISMVRGSGSFEITSFGARMRLLGEMRNA